MLIMRERKIWKGHSARYIYKEIARVQAKGSSVRNKIDKQIFRPEGVTFLNTTNGEGVPRLLMGGK